jgi:hypothetical protein
MRIILLLFLFIGCSSVEEKKINTPEWVIQLRTGDSTLKLRNGDDILFRSNYKDSKLDRNDICNMALNKNMHFIKKTYPLIEKIPMTVELIFYDAEVKDCSTTISVSTSLIQKMESIGFMKKKYEEEIRAINNEKLATQAKLEEIKKVAYVSLKEKGNIDSVQIGMTENEVKELGIDRLMETASRTLCAEEYRRGVTNYKHWQICWNEYNPNGRNKRVIPIVTKVCDMLTKECRTR